MSALTTNPVTLEMLRVAAKAVPTTPDPRKSWGPSDALATFVLYERARAEFWRLAYLLREGCMLSTEMTHDDFLELKAIVAEVEART